MRTVTVSQTGKIFRAISGEKKSIGITIGEAIDALTVQLENADKETIFIVQRFQPDEFFTAEQQNRLSELMQKLREAQAENREMNPQEKAELENLIGEELEGSAKRVETLAEMIK
jgi:hypothetical protein